MGASPATLQFGSTVLAEIPFAEDESVRKLRPAMVIAIDLQESTALLAPIYRSRRRDLRSGTFGLYGDDLHGQLLKQARLDHECAVNLNRLVRLPLHRPFVHGTLGRIDFDDRTLAKRFMLAAQSSTNWEAIRSYLQRTADKH